jgi:hypothetical protein
VHHVDDVIAGFAAALVFATPLALQAVASHAALEAAIDGDGGGTGNGGGGAAAWGAATPASKAAAIDNDDTEQGR